MLSLPWKKSRKLNLRFQRKKSDSQVKTWNSKHSMISLRFCAHSKYTFTPTQIQTITVKKLFRNIEIRTNYNTNTNTVTIRIPDTWIPNSMGVQYSNGSHVTWQTFRILDISDHKQVFLFRLSNNHLSASPFYNQTQINHSNTRLVQYSDGYFMHFCWYM